MSSVYPGAEDSLLLIVDIQEKLFRVMSLDDQRRLRHSVSLLSLAASELDVPQLVTEQYPKGLGSTIPEVMPQDATVLDKMDFSAWRDEAIRKWIEAQQRKNIIICGIEAHVCVTQTALDLTEAGYAVYVAGDAVASRRSVDREMALTALRHQGVRVFPSESIGFMLLGRAGSAAFKAFSSMIR